MTPDLSDFEVPNAKIVYRALAELQGQVWALTEAIFFVAARDPKKSPSKAAPLSDLQETRDLFRILPERIEKVGISSEDAEEIKNIIRGVEHTSGLLVALTDHLIRLVEEEEGDEGEGNYESPSSLLSRLSTWKGAITRHAVIEALKQAALGD